MKKINKTLVAITFYERKKYLHKILNYYNQFEDELDIIILDQSKETWHSPYHSKIKSWHHFPAEKFNFYQMWDKVCSLYNNYEFIYWNNDDDFVTPAGIRMAEEFLIDNPDYSLAQGQIVQISADGNGITEYGNSEWFKEDCNQQDTEVRLNKIFTNAYVNPHATIRLKTWHSAIKLVLESIDTSSSLAPIRFWDKIITLMAGIEGHRKTNLPCVTAIRTHRNFTGAMLHTEGTYPEVLERSTPYEHILKRLGEKNPFSPLIKKKTHLIKDKQINEFVIQLLNPKNIGFSKYPYEKKSHLPINQECGRMQLNHVIKAILSNKNEL
mgnify:CR=1 FL=1